METFVTVRRLDGGQYGIADNVVNFYSDMGCLVKQLPCLISNINMIFVQILGRPVREHVVKPACIHAALSWLKQHNPLYADVIVDEKLLAQMEKSAKFAIFACGFASNMLLGP